MYHKYENENRKQKKEEKNYTEIKVLKSGYHESPVGTPQIYNVQTETKTQQKYFSSSSTSINGIDFKA